jgi:DDE superfamily endonuclease
VPLWVSGVLPGSTHDLTAARELVLAQARPYLGKMPLLADSGYEGAGAGVHVPVRKPARGELDAGTRTLRLPKISSAQVGAVSAFTVAGSAGCSPKVLSAAG